jgi:hypothetical protein
LTQTSKSFELPSLDVEGEHALLGSSDSLVGFCEMQLHQYLPFGTGHEKESML